MSETGKEFTAAYPEALRSYEHKLLKKRREAIQLSLSPDRLVGFALSGGGIRCATFALGLFQGLAKKTKTRSGLLRHIDYISTVSGGGYFGSFFGRLLSREYVQTPDDVEDILLGRKEPRVLGFLRENGRYMSPNGAGDSLLLGAALLRNWVSIHLLLTVFLLAVFLGLQSLRGVVDLWFSPYLEMKTDALVWWSPLLWLPLLFFFLWALPVGWAYWLVEGKPIDKGDPKTREKSDVPPATGAFLVLVVSALLSVFTWGHKIALLWMALAGTSFLALLVWRLARRKSVKDPDMTQALYQDQDIRNRLSRWLTTALVTTGLLLALALVDSLGQSLYAVIMGSSSVGIWLTALFSSLGVLTGFSRWIAIFFSKGPKGDRPPLPLKLVSTAVALLLMLLLLVSLNAASHAITWGMAKPKGAPDRLVEEEKKDQRIYDVEVQGRSPLPLGMNVRIQSGEPHSEPSPKKLDEIRERDLSLAFLGFAGALVLSFLFGQTWPFLNRSSHQPIYGARLTRAYLGASNKKRWEGGHSLTEPVEEDDLDLASYWPPPASNGAPIHLINVTINETVDGQSQIQQQDRKGLGLALGPGGMSAGVKHHMILSLGEDDKKNPKGEPIFEIHPQASTDFKVFDYKQGEGAPRFQGEMLPLGAWISISGAAFSTGTGLRTSLGMSFLAGFGNVRLGRWWDSGIVRTLDRASRKISLRIEDAFARLFPVQTYLLDEFLARFPGTARRHWYLSDGGHFENMGGYELLRRRLRFIVIVDGEMDSEYTCEGLANLVRKARIDFGAEVRFLTEEQLDKTIHKDARPYIGTLEQLRRGRWDIPEKKDKNGPHGRLEEANETGLSLAHAALARVTYDDSDDQTVSWLLYIKPTLTGREPVDLLEYHKAHSKFPHEPTIDQFFDEAQWESYRRLGQYIAEMLFGKIEQLLPESGKSGKTLLQDWSWKQDEAAEKKEGRLLSYS